MTAETITNAQPKTMLPSFWQSRERLTQIHQYAQARRVSPWAVLGGVLARVIAATPPEVQLPATVGGYGSLNMFVGIVGKSGQGKGASQAAAASLIETTGGALFDEVTIGSGEGIAASYMERIKGEDGSMQLHQHSESALFDVAEIDTLASLAGRSGSTLLAELRKVWAGERLGFQNRDRARTLPVEAHVYRAALVAGIQPARSAALLDDADGGTPQRFIWLSATDQNAPDHAPAVPEPIVWQMPNQATLPNIEGRRVMDVCLEARNLIDDARVARLRGQGHALDGHALLARLKVAAALALLDERGDVSVDDWALAGQVMAVSDAARQECRDVLAAAAKNANHARAEARAEANVVTADHTEIAALERAKERILTKVTLEWEGAATIRKTLSGRIRPHFDQAVTELLGAGSIEVLRDEYLNQPRVRIRLHTGSGDNLSPLTSHPQEPRKDAGLEGWPGRGGSRDEMSPLTEEKRAS